MLVGTEGESEGPCMHWHVNGCLTSSLRVHHLHCQLASYSSTPLFSYEMLSQWFAIYLLVA
jgi:hypothetical protein